jgi:hypothetical protein
MSFVLIWIHIPSLTKQESADEVAQAVMESDLKWEGVNWKEAVRFLVLGRDEPWCRSSKLRRVLPWRRSKKGTRPGLTGVHWERMPLMKNRGNSLQLS